MTDLTTKKNPELVTIYNGLNPPKQLKGYKGKKGLLIARIEALRSGPAKAGRATRDGSIRAYCESLLLEANSVDAKTKRPLGLPYDEILRRVAKRFPEAETSVNCLRWYATKLNNQHRDKRNPRLKVILPDRPTAQRRKAA